MKNLSNLLLAGFMAAPSKRTTVKTTIVEGLALDDRSRCPVEGVRISIFLHSEEAGRILIHETFTDNNGYFSSIFQAEEDIYTISPSKENYNYYGLYTVVGDGSPPVECEEVKHGKKQFFTFALDTEARQRVPASQQHPLSLKQAFSISFLRMVGLPIFRTLFF